MWHSLHAVKQFYTDFIAWEARVDQAGACVERLGSRTVYLADPGAMDTHIGNRLHPLPSENIIERGVIAILPCSWCLELLPRSSALVRLLVQSCACLRGTMHLQEAQRLNMTFSRPAGLLLQGWSS